MKKRVYLLNTIVILIILSVNRSIALVQQDLEWKVNVGDSKTYTLDKYFDDDDLDGDGNKNTQTETITDENGDDVELVLKKGSTLKVTITKLNSVATVKRTFNGEVTTKETTMDPSMVMKTVDNKSYWEDQAESMSAIMGQEASVDGDLFILEIEVEVVVGELILTTVTKTNWKTGWVTYLLLKAADENATISEIEYSAKAEAAPGFELVSVLSGFFIITLIIVRKRK